MVTTAVERWIELRNTQRTWQLHAATDKPAVVHIGLDSEGGERDTHNLLEAPLELRWMQETDPLQSWTVEHGENELTYRLHLDKGDLFWRIRQEGDAFTFTLWSEAWCPIYDLAMAFHLSTRFCPTTVIPHDFTDDYRLQSPFLLVAPDHGHLYVEIEAPMDWHATLNGNRLTQKLLWMLRCGRTFEKGDRVAIRFSPKPIAKPVGVDEALWNRVRRPWLNQFQLNAHENDVETPMMLANNVLSNPAIALAALYGDAMLFLPEPLPGIHLPRFLRHTLDDWFTHRVMQHGNVACFAKSDTYLFTNPMLIRAAWDYMQMTDDHGWLQKNIDSLQLVADFILRRDQDQDGLTESMHSGNAWSLRDPDRSDFYLESINFGHKNAYTNAMAYRAYHCMADLLGRLKYSKAVDLYLRAAQRLKEAYVRTFFNPKTGVLAGWISQDGQMHDYIFPFVNGYACALGLVEREQARAILGRIIAQLRELNPRGWRWGVPVNLLPVPDFDLMQPAFRIDGSTPHWPMMKEPFPMRVDELGWPRWDDPDGTRSFRGRALYNGATQTALTADLILGLLAVGLHEEADCVLEPLLQTTEAGDLQNGLHVKSGGGAEHHDWEGNPTGYEGYLPEGWFFLTAALLRHGSNLSLLHPIVME